MIFNSVKYKISTLLAVLALGCAGCHNSDAPLPPGVEDPDAPDPDKLMLCLNVSFDGQYGATRADNDPDGYQDPSGDFEKISTLRVIILRDVSKDPETGVESGIVEANRLVMTNDAGRPMYDDLQFKVIANEWKRIYLIANEEYLPSSPQANTTATQFLDSFKTPRQGATGVVTDLTELTNWTVSVPNLTPSTTQIIGYPNGLFSPTSSRRLPLTESFDVFTKRDENDPDDKFFAQLFMTRAAAKAMFYITTGENFATEVSRPPYIQAISLSGVGSTEFVFPNNAIYSPSKESLISVSAEDKIASKIETYIADFSTPEDNKELTYVVDDLINTVIKRPADGNMLPLTTVPIYFPESILQPGEHYKVGVQLNTGEWLYADLVEDERDVPDEEKTAHNILRIVKNGVECDAIARNTYLPIEIKFDGAMDLTVNVLPWDREDHYVEFSANVGITNEGCLAFEGAPGQAGDYLLLDKTAGQLVLNYGKTVQGSFTISSPLGYTWDAYLITTGGSQDAIQFEIPDPTDTNKKINTTHISGEIGKEAKFGIVTTVAPGSEQNSAQLIVMATLATGTQVIVDVMKNWGEGNPGILTVIENPL